MKTEPKKDYAELMQLARRIAADEGSHRAAGVLFNAAALLLAEAGISNDELHMRLHAAFLRVDMNEIDQAIAKSRH